MNEPRTTERSIEPTEIDHELLAFIVDRYRRGEPLPSLGKRVPDLLAHILWLEEQVYA